LDLRAVIRANDPSDVVAVSSNDGFSRKLRRWSGRAIGPVLLLVIWTRIDLDATLAALSGIPPGVAAVAVGLLIPQVVLRGIRWRRLASDQGIHMGYAEAASAYAVAIALGSVTPGRIGELSKVEHLRRKAGSVSRALVSVVLDRAFDLAALAAFGAVGLARIGGIEHTALAAGITAGLGSAVVAIAILRRTHSRSPRDQSIPPDRSLRGRLLGGLRLMVSESAAVTVPTYLVSGGITAVVWSLHFWALSLVAQTLGIQLPFIDIAGVLALAALAAAVPVSILGVGTRDGALIVLMGWYGVAAERAVALSFAILALLLVNAVLCAPALLTPAGRLSWSARDRPRSP